MQLGSTRLQWAAGESRRFKLSSVNIKKIGAELCTINMHVVNIRHIFLPIMGQIITKPKLEARQCVLSQAMIMVPIRTLVNQPTQTAHLPNQMHGTGFGCRSTVMFHSRAHSSWYAAYEPTQGSPLS